MIARGPARIATAAAMLALALAFAPARAAAVGTPLIVPPLGNAQLALGPQESVTLAWTSVESQEYSEEGVVAPEGKVLFATGTPQAGFGEPQTISEPGDSADLSSFVADAAGDQLVTWSSSRSFASGGECSKYGCNPGFIGRGLWLSRRLAGQSFTAPERISPLPDATNPLAAMNAAGDAVVSFEAGGAIYVRFASRESAFGAPVRALAIGHGEGELHAEAVELDGAAEAMLTLSGYGPLAVAFGTADGGFARPVVLSKPGRHGEPYVLGAVSATGAGGQRLLTWSGQKTGRFAYRPAGARFGAVQTLGRRYPIAATIDDSGVAHIIAQGASGKSTSYEALDVSSEGKLSAPRVIAVEGNVCCFGDTPAFAADGSGAMIVGLLGHSPGAPAGEATMAALRGQDGAFGTPDTLEAGPKGSVWPPRTLPVPLVAANDGTVAAAWAANGVFSAGPGAPVLAMLDFEEWSSAGAQRLTLALPAPPSALPSYEPASFVFFDDATRPDGHGRLHGSALCESEARACVVEAKLVEAATPSAVLASATFRLEAGAEARVTMRLSGAALARLRRAGRLNVEVETVTRSGSSAASDWGYPLTLRPTVARHRAHRCPRSRSPACGRRG